MKSNEKSVLFFFLTSLKLSFLDAFARHSFLKGPGNFPLSQPTSSKKFTSINSNVPGFSSPAKSDELGIWKLVARIDGEENMLFLLLSADGTAKTAATEIGQDFPRKENEKKSKRSLEGFWEVTPTKTFKLRVNKKTNMIDSRDLSFEGKVFDEGKRVEGVVREGTMDPEYVGSFQLDSFLPFLRSANLFEFAAPEPPKLKWEMSHFEGNWNIINTKTGTVLQVHLLKNGVFCTVGGVGNDNKIGGRWHLAMGGYQKDLDTIYLSCIRSHSKGVEMQTDYMQNYWGIVEGKLSPESINGVILYGTFEPLIIGSFEMRPAKSSSGESLL